MQGAFFLWERHERRHAEILFAVDLAEAFFVRGESRQITTHQQTAQLADDGKRRALARLAAEDSQH